VKPENKVCKKKKKWGGEFIIIKKKMLLYIYIYKIEGAKIRKREKVGTKMN
jgi:hypothetical protein